MRGRGGAERREGCVTADAGTIFGVDAVADRLKAVGEGGDEEERGEEEESADVEHGGEAV